MFKWRRLRMPREGCCSCRRRRWQPHVVQVSQRSESGEGTRSVAPDSLQGSAKAVAGRVAQRWCHRFGQGPTHAIGSLRFGRMVVKQELRAAQCSGVRRCRVDCQTRHFVEPRGNIVGVDHTRRTYGREDQVVQDDCIDRRSRFETQVSGERVTGVAFHSVEPGVRNARYGLRGVRVEEASQPGPLRRRDEDDVLENLEFALTMIVSDDEPLTRFAHSRPDGHVGEACSGRRQAAPQPTWPDDDSVHDELLPDHDGDDATVGSLVQSRTRDSGVPGASVRTPSMLVS